MWADVLKRARASQTPASGYGTVAGVQAAGDNAIDRETNYGERGTQDYLSRAESFDASKALNKYASGAWSSISTALKDQLATTAGQSVGAGRFDSGFLDEDKGVVINRATDQFSNALAGQSMNAVAMDQRNTESLGAFGSERSGRGEDLLAARSEQVQNDAREEAERKRKSKAGLLGGLGTLAGTALGGPIGGGIGGAIGSYVGGL